MTRTHRWYGLALILMSALLQGCVTGGAVRGVATEPDKGTIVIRPTFEGFKYVNTYSLLGRKVGAEDSFSMSSWNMASDGYWTHYYDDMERGELVVMSMPAGEYEVHGWSIGASGWGGLRHSVAKDRLAYRFRVEPGKAVYLGNVHVKVTGDAGITPAAFTTSKYKATSSVRDTRVRDFAELPKLAPGLAPERVEVRLLR